VRTNISDERGSFIFRNVGIYFRLNGAITQKTEILMFTLPATTLWKNASALSGAEA
jgi:hypothetical protein